MWALREESVMTLTPAYGRDYKSKALAIKDFDAGKDFIADDYQSPGYITKKELLALNIHKVNIRYKKLTMVVVHKF